MAQRAAEAVVQEFALSTSEDHVKNASVLDFGCGTGLCAFHVVPMVAHLVGVDASEGMLNHLNHKLTTNPSNASIRDKVKTVQHLITYDDPLPESERLQYLTGPDAGFDMIYSSFVMHHIEDLQGTTNTLAQKLLKKDGWLIVLDFSGFHDHGHGHHADDEKHGHHHGPGSKPRDASTYYVDADGKPLEFVPHKAGFTNEGFVEIFKKAGLVDVEAKHSFGMNREWNGKTIWNDVLVVKGRRP
ncbi:S-adenosyl-L-methionine-dependent methyltransferase [Gamsiella multidivaricata]|uniref:S-adenosyl-L-methionine-dependent methyltransferase n=1 Tax=Gamsiella multidivaricata TaxID=101098 RepID=UPI002220E3CD|nr:S-adenosyl-L-methionine-dependent methyltransferase [Gamsiella multidivaricata]KAI7827165.1 S-adenosyl-L-methionine-dependent methyltransferase [Gamsiella multidivaricata]